MDKKISALDLVTTLDTGDVLPIVNQLTTKKVTVSQIIDGLATTVYVNSQDALKVDKVTGKGLSAEDYTTTEKSKLAGIQAGAEVNVNADWNAVSGDAQILNKPTIPSVSGFVPYTGATSDINLGEFGIQLGNLEFDNTPTNIPTTSGSMYYNDADGTLDLILKGGNVTLQVGQETVIRVVNKTATSISLLESNYQAVRITGAQGQRPKVDLAQATSDVLSAETIGLVTETIANNQEGFITTSGLVRGINTTGSLQGETWLDGDIIYLSPTVAGSLTKVKPVAPNHLIIIGYVIYAHITQGTIFVKVDNGYELNELHNVKINGVANNNVLAYTSSTSIWENKTVETALGYTPVASNTAIAGATKTKITYDAKGLVTAGADIATTDISDFNSSSRAQTEAELVAGSNITITPSGTGATRQLTIASTGGGGGTQGAYTVLANNTNSSASPTEQPFENLTNQIYTPTPVWTGTTAPSGTTEHTYSLSQIGNLVTLTINLSYGVAGSGLTQVVCDLPSTAPTPAVPSSVSIVGDIVNFGIGVLTTNKNLPTTNLPYCALRIKSLGTPNIYEIAATRALATYRYAYITIQYFV